MKTGFRRVVLAYSGGLDTSVILRWLIETHGCEVVAFLADLGQAEDLEAFARKAERLGACGVYVEDLREEFVRDFVYAALRANAVYEGGYLMGTSLARPLIAKKQLEIAAREQADAVAHGATGKGNDQVRFELTYFSLNPHIRVLAPWREWAFKGRQELIDYAIEHDIPVPTTREKPYSTDRNLFHTSYEGGILEDPWDEPDEKMFQMTQTVQNAPERSQYLEIGFDQGTPVTVDGERLGPVALLTHLNEIGGTHGIGRIDMVENRFVGMKSRGVYETPGGTILHIAHRAVESLTMDREVMHLRDSLVPKFAELIYYGFWYSPEMGLLQQFMDEAQRHVTGTARLKLYKGNCWVVGRKSPTSLYHPQFATFEAEDVYRQADAEGFIKLNALRLRIRSLLHA
ncbi:MAG TPA: argininosuccinate synthase [Candidatus Tectomicrobia bacterium]|nr:argininosuccinate synthase [Candidatus Tectomicrobia bacterium]